MRFCFALSAVVLPGEGDALIIDGDDAPVRDGDAVRVTRQIPQHLLGASERPFGVDNPVDAANGREIPGEGTRIAERCQGVKELQTAAGVGRGELLQEQAAIEPLQNLDWQEETRATGDPSLRRLRFAHSQPARCRHERARRRAR